MAMALAGLPVEVASASIQASAMEEGLGAGRGHLVDGRRGQCGEEGCEEKGAERAHRLVR